MRIFDGGNDADLHEAAMLLRGGDVVAIPTETVYGLAADASSPAAVARIYAIKGRPDSKPLPVLVGGPEDAARVCRLPPSPAAFELMTRYWPGPLTLVLPVQKERPASAPLQPGAGIGPGATLACRCPDHPAALAILRYAGIPLALTSANRSGEKPPMAASQITLTGLGGIVDSGPCGVGRPSAVLDVTRDPPEILRHSAPVIGVTGGSGAGKSAVMDRLGELGAAVIRADGVYHKLLQSDEAMLDKLRGRFTDAFPTPGGPFNRAVMRRLAFEDTKALADLNRITHPHVLSEIRRMMAQVFFANKAAPAAIEAIALIGSGLDSLCTVKVAVTAGFETRVERIMSRDGLSREDALLRIQNQKSDSFYTANCDIALENSGTLSELTERVDNIWKTYVTS